MGVSTFVAECLSVERDEISFFVIIVVFWCFGWVFLVGEFNICGELGWCEWVEELGFYFADGVEFECGHPIYAP